MFRSCDIKDEYRKIPYGGWKVLAGLLAVALYIPAMVCIVEWWNPDGAPLIRLPEAAEGSYLPLLTVSFYVSLYGVCGTAVMIIFLFQELRDTGGIWPFPWLRAYWKRNRHGYLLHYTLDGEMKLAEKIYEPRYSLQRIVGTEIVQSSSPVHVLLPLGGWWKKGGVYYNTLGWQRRHEVSVRVEERTGKFVCLTDHTKAQVSLPVEYALHILSSPLVRKGWLLWGDMVINLYTAYSLWEKVRRRGEPEGIVRQLDNEQRLLGIIGETIRQLEDTKRFIRSKEGEAIRTWLQQEITKMPGFPSEPAPPTASAVPSGRRAKKERDRRG